MAYRIQGTVRASDGTPLMRDVYVLNRSTLGIIDKQRTGLDGIYSFRVMDTNPKLLIAMPDALDTSNAICLDNIIPYDDLLVDTSNIFGIGTPGDWGFGQGVCLNPPDNFIPMPGYTDPQHENFGNYKYAIDGSIMIWIPKFYYKWGTGTNGLALNDCDIKGTYDFADEATANLSGYALHRSFIDGGEIKDGFFIDKYLNSKHPTLPVASSICLADTIAFTGGYGASVATLFSGIPNQISSAIDIAKFRGDGFFCCSIFQHMALAMLSYAHGLNSSSTEKCGWYSAVKSYPRGTTSTSQFRDSIDANTCATQSITGFTYVIKTGSFVNREKNTHNGQLCGVVDVSGNCSKLGTGLTYLSSNFRILKESFSMKDGTSGTSSPTDFWDASIRPYDLLGPTLSDYSTTSGWIYATSGTQIFDESTDRTSLGYKYTNMGIYKAGNFSTSNTYALGGGTYRYQTNNLFPFCGADYTSSTNGGPWTLDLRYVNTNGSNNSALRSAYYIH